MLHTSKISVAAALMALAIPVPAQSQSPQLPAELEEQVIRSIGFDLCLPADGAEYEKIGKNAVIMLTASTAISSELPLKSVFVEIGGVRIPLQRLARLDATQNGDRTKQVSFYLVPIQLTKKSSRLAADFTGGRGDFGIATFGPAFYAKGAPGFARLDEYDDPSEPDPASLAALLVREYPEFFGEQ
jgi:hypothetical protein